MEVTTVLTEGLITEVRGGVYSRVTSKGILENRGKDTERKVEEIIAKRDRKGVELYRLLEVRKQEHKNEESYKRGRESEG